MRSCRFVTIAVAAFASVAIPASFADRTIVSPNEIEFGSFGRAVGYADLSGDSFGDLIVGGPVEAAASFSGAGRVYFISGADGSAFDFLESPTAQTDGFFGQTLVRIPDVTGDALDDVAVGTNETDGGAIGGRIYIVDPAARSIVMPIEAAAGDASEFFGDVIAGVPDTNGDGFGEVLVRSRHFSGSIGKAFLYDGATGAELFVFTGGAEFGETISGVPDLNGDGRGDIAVRSLGVSVYDGALHSLIYVQPGPNSGFGSSIAGSSDLDGDGFGDIIVGSPTEISAEGSMDAGRVRILSGASGEQIYAIESPSGLEGGNMGSIVLPLPDLTGDGTADLLSVTDELFDGTRNRARLFSGRDGALLQTLVRPEPTANLLFVPSFGVIPDADGDGRAELFIGCPVATGTGGLQFAGRLYLRNIADAYPPDLAYKNGIVAGFGEITPIKREALLARDGDTTASLLQFEVTEAPTNGTLLVGGIPASEGASFTQADIDAGDVEYWHAGIAGGADSFAFDLTDDASHVISALSFAINILDYSRMEEMVYATASDPPSVFEVSLRTGDRRRLFSDSAPETLGDLVVEDEAAVLISQPARLRRIDRTTGAATLFGEAGDGNGHIFASPRGMVRDLDGTLIAVAESLTTSTLRISLATGARTPVTPFGGPGGRGIALLDAQTYIFSNRAPDSSLQTIDRATGSIEIVARHNIGTGPLFTNIYGVAVLPDGRVLATAAQDCCSSFEPLDAIMAFDPATGDRTLVSDASTGLGFLARDLRDIELTPDGMILACDALLGTLWLVDPETGNRVPISSSPDHLARGAGPAFSEAQFGGGPEWLALPPEVILAAARDWMLLP